jgi:hypothetical protein
MDLMAIDYENGRQMKLTENHGNYLVLAVLNMMASTTKN